MNRFKIYAVCMNTNIEFSDGKLTGWNEESRTLYCYKNIIEARKNVWHKKQEEVKMYREWLKKPQKNRGCFIHHFYEISELDVF